MTLARPGAQGDADPAGTAGWARRRWAATGFGYFWPGWVLGAWGVFLLLDAWNAFFRRPLTDADVEEELHR